MKAHLIDTHLLVPRSRSPAKVKVKYQGHICKKKNGCFGGISVSQTHFVYYHFQKYLPASEFLQNVVYINLQLSDEDRVSRDTHYHTIPTYNDSEEGGFGKHCGKRRKCW